MATQNDEHSTKRIVMTYRGIIDCPPSRVFPLLCPVREEEWIDGWTKDMYRLVHSDSGFNEQYCVFQEHTLKPFLLGEQGPTTWVTTSYEPKQFRLEFVLVFGDLALLNRAVRLEAVDDNATACQWTDTVTFLKNGLTDEERENFEGRLRGFSQFLGSILKSYCETGEMLRGTSPFGAQAGAGA